MEENKNTGSLKITIVKLCSVFFLIWFALTTIVCILVLLFGGATFGAWTDFWETVFSSYFKIFEMIKSDNAGKPILLESAAIVFRFLGWGLIIFIFGFMIVEFLIGLIKYIILLTKKDENGMRTGLAKFHEYFLVPPVITIVVMLFLSLISNKNPYGVFSFLLIFLMIIPIQLVYKILTEYVFKPDQWIIYEKYYGKGKAIGEIALSMLYNFLRFILLIVACILLCREAVGKQLFENIPYLFDKYETQKIFYVGALINTLFVSIMVSSFFKVKNLSTLSDEEALWKKYMIWAIIGTVLGIGVSSILCKSYTIGEILKYWLPILIVAILGFVTYKLPTLSKLSAKKKAIEDMERKKAEIAASVSNEEQQKTE